MSERIRKAFVMVDNGEILDAKTLILLQRLAIKWGKSPIYRLPVNEPIGPKKSREKLKERPKEKIARTGRVATKVEVRRNGRLNVGGKTATRNPTMVKPTRE